jgi:uncharacterized membrane protein YfcA
MFDPNTIILIFGVFFFAGFVKGIIGLGLPTISLALLTVTTDLPTAMVLLIMPSLVTNFWQAANGKYWSIIFRRFWPFLLICVMVVPIGAEALLFVDLSYLSILLGMLIFFYSLAELNGFSLEFNLKYEKVLGFVMGTFTGLLTGMTGSCVFPGVMFLQATRLNRDVMVQAMGILFSLTTLSLGFSLSNNNFLNYENGMLSNAGVIPAIFGMIVGTRVRKNFSKTTFRKVFFLSLLVLGVFIVFQSLDFLKLSY